MSIDDRIRRRAKRRQQKALTRRAKAQARAQARGQTPPGPLTARQRAARIARRIFGSKGAE